MPEKWDFIKNKFIIQSMSYLASMKAFTPRRVPTQLKRTDETPFESLQRESLNKVKMKIKDLRMISARKLQAI